jgi:hypothetical protein
LRLPSIFRFSLPADHRLAPLVNVPALPSNLISDSHRLLYPLGAALQLISDRRRRSTFRPCLRTQHPTPIFHCVPSAVPSGSSSAFAADELPALPVDPTLNSSSVESLRRCLSAFLRLSPPIRLPALPVDPTSDSSTIVFSAGAFRVNFDLRLRSTFLPTLLSTVDFRLRSLFRPRL